MIRIKNYYRCAFKLNISNLKRIILFLSIVILLINVATPVCARAAATNKVICVSAIKGNIIKYYDVKFVGEWGQAYGKIKKMKISKNLKIYCLLGDDITPATQSTRVSKPKFKKLIKRTKKWNGKGYYTNVTIKNGKCIKLDEPYFP